MCCLPGEPHSFTIRFARIVSLSKQREREGERERETFCVLQITTCTRHVFIQPMLLAPAVMSGSYLLFGGTGKGSSASQSELKRAGTEFLNTVMQERDVLLLSSGVLVEVLQESKLEKPRSPTLRDKVRSHVRNTPQYFFSFPLYFFHSLRLPHVPLPSTSPLHTRELSINICTACTFHLQFKFPS